MASRVEKYYDEYVTDSGRSQKNQELYEAISELDRITEKDLAKLHSLFKDFETQRKSLDSLYFPPKPKSRESLYSVLEDTTYDPFDLMVQRQYDKEVKEKAKIKELANEITDHLDILKTQELHLENLKDLTYHPDKKAEKKEVLSSFPKPSNYSSALSKSVSQFFDDGKEDEKVLNLRIKKIVLIAFIVNSFLIAFLLYLFIH